MHHGLTFTRRGTTVLALLASAAAAACSEAAPPVAPAVQGASASAADIGLPDGDYVADLHPLNALVQTRLDPDPSDGALGVASGKAFFSIRNGQFTARVDAKGMEPGMLHAQHIHLAAACPPASADVNGDGIVDVIEGVPFYGPILVPLDNDLSTQAAGTFSMAVGLHGDLDYFASTSLDAMLADLNATDPNPNDAVVKLNGAPLALGARTVVLHGVDINTFLPPSVQSLGTAPAQLTLPVACGPIRKID